MGTRKITALLFAIALLASFFLPWVNWGGSHISGYAMPAGDFFKAAETKYYLSNPFPKLSFAFWAFLLIPVISIAIILLSVSKKKTGLLPYIAGFLSLSLIALYILFTAYGSGKSPWSSIETGGWIHLVAAIGLIVTAGESSLLKKIGWLVAGPVLVFASFKLTEKYIMGQTQKETTAVKADYTVRSDELIKEFLTNDTAANKKYLEKVLIVNGNASAVDILADSTSTIKFADSTGSYAIFSLEKDQLEKIRIIKAGDAVSLKGVCSGSIFSEILGTTSISFKRAILNHK